MTVAGDLDGDGLMELVVCTFSDTLAVLRQTRARVILPPETDVAGARAEQALLAELFDRSSRTRRRGRVWTCGGFSRQVQPGRSCGSSGSGEQSAADAAIRDVSLEAS